MPIYNFDFGQPNSSLSGMPDARSEADKQLSPANQYNPGVADISVVERWAEEMCNISGAFVAVYLRSENEAVIDEVWDEAQDVIYENPIWMKGVWKPEPLPNELTRFGVDAKNKSIITFARAVTLRDLRRPVRDGDVVAVPQNEIIKDLDLEKQSNYLYCRIITAANSGQFRFRWMYTRCVLEPLSGDSKWLPKYDPV